MVAQIAAAQPQPASQETPASASDQPQSSGGFSQLLQSTLKEQQGPANASKSDGTSGGKTEGPGKKSDSQDSLAQVPVQTALPMAGLIPNLSLSVPAITVSKSAGAAADVTVSSVSANASAPAGNPAMPSANGPILSDGTKGTAPTAKMPSQAASAPVSSAPLPQTAAGQQTVTNPVPNAVTDPVSDSVSNSVSTPAAAVSSVISELPNPQLTDSKTAKTEPSDPKTGKTVPGPAVQADAELGEAPVEELPENPVSAPKAISPMQNGQTAPSEKTDKPQILSPKAEQKTDDAAALIPQTRSTPYGTGTVVIKVSDAPAPHTAQPVFQQVANAISENMKNGRQEFQVDLYPQSLGKVTVKLVSENGLLTVELAASNPKTQSLLLSNSSDIRSILQSSANQQVVVQSQQAPSWYGQQQGGHSGAQQQQQQQQSGQNRQDAQSENPGVIFSAGDFLNLLQKVSSAV